MFWAVFPEIYAFFDELLSFLTSSLLAGFLLASAKKLEKSSKPEFWLGCCLASGLKLEGLVPYVDLLWMLNAENGFSDDLAFLMVSWDWKGLLPKRLFKLLVGLLSIWPETALLCFSCSVLEEFFD